MLQKIKTLYRNMDLETLMLLNPDKFKEYNKVKIADYISYFHFCLVMNTMLSFFYPYTLLHRLNFFIQICTYTDWMHCAYCITHYGKRDECIVTRAENILRTLDSREKEEEHRENKDPDKGSYKRFKPDPHGYIKTLIYDKTGFILPSNWTKILIHSWAGASIYNSYQLI